MPKGSGRKSASEWTEVLECSNNSRVVCKYCQQQISKKVERVRSHLNKCKNRCEYKQEKILIKKPTFKKPYVFLKWVLPKKTQWAFLGYPLGSQP